MLVQNRLNTHTHTSIRLEGPSPPFCGNGFDLKWPKVVFFTPEGEGEVEREKGDCFPPLEEEEEEDGDDEDKEVGVIFFISATRAEARFFTIVSRSDCFDLTPTGMKQ